MQIPPLAVVASWPTPNYDNPTETRGPAILVLTYIFAPLTFITVLLRIYTRLRISRSFGVDDTFILLALISTIACGVLTVVAVVAHGWDRHVWDIMPHQLTTGLKYVIAVEVLYGISTSLTKLSLLFFLRKILSPGTTIIRSFASVAMFVVAAESVILTIVLINTCNPVSAYWTLSIEPQKCINESAHLLAGGIINTFTDACVVLLPIPVVLKLQLPRRQQIMLVALFGAGFITAFAGIFRLYYTHRATTSYDKTWFAYPLWVSGTIELYLGVIAASVPAIKPLISRYLPRLLGSSSTFMGQPSYQNSHSWPQASTAMRLQDTEAKLPRTYSDRRTNIPLPLSSFSTFKNGNSAIDPKRNQQAMHGLAKTSSETSTSSLNNRFVGPAMGR